MNDPRSSSKYGHMYTVDCFNNVVGGRPVLYINQPIDFLMEMAVKSIKSGEPLWFGCDVKKRFANKVFIEDLTMLVNTTNLQFSFALIMLFFFNVVKILS